MPPFEDIRFWLNLPLIPAGTLVNLGLAVDVAILLRNDLSRIGISLKGTARRICDCDCDNGIISTISGCGSTFGTDVLYLQSL